MGLYDYQSVLFRNPMELALDWVTEVFCLEPMMNRDEAQAQAHAHAHCKHMNTRYTHIPAISKTVQVPQDDFP